MSQSATLSLIFTKVCVEDEPMKFNLMSLVYTLLPSETRNRHNYRFCCLLYTMAANKNLN